MADQVRVRIQDPAGSRALDGNFQIEDILGEAINPLVARFQYPTADLQGRPIEYHLYHVEGKAVLDPAAVLSSTEVRDGHRLVLFPAAPGGGGS